MFFLILLGDPIGYREHVAIAGVGEHKADTVRCWSSFLAVAAMVG